MLSFAKKEKIQATLIHLEQEKFPCSDETGDAGRRHPRRRRGKMPEAGGPRLVPSQSSLHGSSALSSLDQGPGSTQAGSAPPARAAAPRLGRGWCGRNRLPHGDPAWGSGGAGQPANVPDPRPPCPGRRLQPPGCQP